jgi:hypothetical protein
MSLKLETFMQIGITISIHYIPLPFPLFPCHPVSPHLPIPSPIGIIISPPLHTTHAPYEKNAQRNNNKGASSSPKGKRPIMRNPSISREEEKVVSGFTRQPPGRTWVHKLRP